MFSAELDMEKVATQTSTVLDELHKVQKDVGEDKKNREGSCCKAGAVILVPTDKPINEWKEIAIRQLPHVEWYLKLD